MKKCSGCKYWSTYSTERRVLEAQNWIKNDCRRHAPVYTIITTNEPYEPKPIWPKTVGQDWCGDWEDYLLNDQK